MAKSVESGLRRSYILRYLGFQKFHEVIAFEFRRLIKET